jgi:hypothetical protein
MLVLVKDAAEAIASSYVEAGYLVRIGDLLRQRVQRACVGDALVGAVSVVELFELVQGVEQVPLVPDQRAVQEFAAAGLYPPFHDRVHSWHPDATEHNLDPRLGEDGVEQIGELAVPVPDQEACPAVGVLEVHDQDACGILPAGRMNV